MATKEKKGAKFGRHARNPSSKLQATRSAKNKRLRIEAAQKRGDTQAGVSKDAESYRSYGPVSEYTPKSATLEQRHARVKHHHDQRAWHLARATCVATMRAVYPCSAVRNGKA